MKRIFTLASLFLTISYSGFAQGEMDAFNLSYNDLTGTARSVAMGGAFGALGGDISGVSINPAGIGVYKSYEIATTLNFRNTESKTNLLGSKMDDKKSKFNFDNFGFVGIVPLNSDDVPLLNFGFSYNKLKSFDRKVAMRGNGLGTSLTDYIANRANDQNYRDITSEYPYDTGADWLSILGYQGGLIELDDANNFYPTIAEGEKANNDLYIREKGEVSSYDFNMGATIADVLSIGATLSVTDIYYKMSSSYYETFLDNGDNFELANFLKTKGTGWQVKAGLIFKPVQEFRIGVAYHSPTWYEMTDYYSAGVANSWDVNNKPYYTPDYAFTDYKFRTPDKWVISTAGVIGKTAIISADYELTNYKNMKFSDREDFSYGYEFENNDIKQDFKNASTLRVGAELRITPQFSARVGYMWQESPVKDGLKEGSLTGNYTAATAGTVSHYSVVGDANYITWGLGYRFTPSFYTDIAFVIKNRKDDLYSYGGADRAELKTNQFTGLLTLGYKF